MSCKYNNCKHCGYKSECEIYKENAELKKDNEGYEKDNARLVQQYNDLQKENAELKTDYEVLSCSVGDFGELQDKLEEEQRKNNGLSDNLTKTKEMLKGWLDDYYNPKPFYQQRAELVEQSEQFLKGAEMTEEQKSALKYYDEIFIKE